MRVFASCVAVVMCAACGQSGDPEPAPHDPAATAAMRSGSIDPGAITRVRTALPAGYEVADLSGPAAPINLWGLGSDWRADPTECSVLAESGGDQTSGWSASGPGGIVYAVVARAMVGQGPSVGDPCGAWRVSGGRSDASVAYLPAPTIDSVATVGLAADVTTEVEGGTETHSHADTFTAYLGDHVAYAVLVTDPGSPGPPLPPGFAADLLVKTVSAIRG